MRLGRRVRAAERVLGRPALVTWEQANEAEERINASILADLQAMVDGPPPPVHDDAQYAEDERVLAQWCRQQGEPEDERSDAEVLEELKRLAAGATQ